MAALSLIFSFCLGAIVGSFLNVVSLRFNSGAGVGGRSKCMSCGKQLAWKELVPLLSFMVQRGACKKCGSRISYQYPLIEFGAGAIFVLVFLAFPPVTPAAAFETFLYVFATCLLLVIAVYDTRHKIIPDPFVYAFAAAAFVGMFVGGESWLHVPGWSPVLAGPALALPFALFWLISKGAWMGLGDAKLVLGMAWFLGWEGGIDAIILAFWIGAFVSIAWLLLTSKKLEPRTEVPFGPYLILGFYAVLLFKVNIIDFSLVRELIFQSSI